MRTGLRLRRVLKSCTFALLPFLACFQSAWAQTSIDNFFVGGRYQRVGAGHLMLGQMYVERHAPLGSPNAIPVIFVHGSGQTGAGFVSTPDGRPGWTSLFAEKGWGVFVVDQVGRGRSALFADLQGPVTRITAERTEQLFTAPARHMLWPQARLHTRWPGTGVRGDATFDAFYAAQVEGIADPTRVEQLNVDALIALLERIGPAVLVTHSQSGPFGWVVADRRPELVRGIIAIEPNGPPFMDGSSVGGDEWYRESTGLARPWGISRLPLTFEPTVTEPSELRPSRQGDAVSGDLIPCWSFSGSARRLSRLTGIPTAIVTAEASFRAGVDHCTVRFLASAEVPVQHLRLAERGITGNGHMMMLETNNGIVARAIMEWLEAHVR